MARTTVKSTCSYCGVGCGVEITRDTHGRLHLRGDEEHPVNMGMLCSKGRALHHAVQDHSSRLLYPMMRRSRGHALERVSWDQAMQRAAGVFRSLIERHGPESVAIYVSGQCLTEEYYIANKLMKGFIGSNNIDTNSRLCMSSAVAGYKMTVGDDLVPISYADIELGTCYLIAGANPAWCHPILFRRLEKHKEQHPEKKIIVVDPRRTQTCALADLHLQIQPGTDVVLFNAIAREMFENDWLDHTFLKAHAEGLEHVREAAFTLDLETTAEICRVPADDIRLAARWIGEAKAFQSWWAMGLNQSAMGVDKNLALLNLSLLRGQIGKPGAGPFSLTGQPNAMGGREVGGLATMLAAHRDLANAEHREEVARYWGSGPIAAKPGLTALEMFDALESGSLKAIWVICTSPAVSMPSLKRAHDALKKARFVVVQDISQRSETIQFADLVLPAAGWLEKQGAMTNSERRVSYLPKLLHAPGEALADVEILCRFAKTMGWGEHFSYANESEIFAEHCALTRGTVVDVSGLSHDRLRREGSIQWPCPSPDHPGTPRLFSDHRFATPNGKARLHGVTYSHDSETASDEYPFIMTSGRMRDQWHTMTRTGNVAKLREHGNGVFVEMNPEDAADRGLHDGDRVRVSSERGELTVPLHISDALKRGVVFMPIHWNRVLSAGEGRVNFLTSERFDPRSREPDFKFAVVNMERVAQAARRIVVIGGGAAALQFVQTYRERNTTDELHVFAREPYLFYNRVHLPEYISGERSFEELRTCSDQWLAENNVTFHAGAGIKHIDRTAKSVVDESDSTWSYDTLVIATGSRAILPADVPDTAPNIFTLRTRNDADRISTALRPGANAIVVGGGLLALELASTLLTRGLKVTVLHRSARLMRGQLDATASTLLADELRDQGINVLLGERVAEVNHRDMVESVRTASGRYLPCDALFYAVGTQPNVELARAAGLDCAQGVRVDDTLRSSDPNIYAVGEVAEHRGKLYGTTPAAQMQAEVAAKHLAGDDWTRYHGSIGFNVLKIHGLSVCSIGLAEMPDSVDRAYEEIITVDSRERTYLKCIVHRNRLVGATLIGDATPMAEFKQWIESGVELDEHRTRLLRPGAASTAAPIKGRLVCSCLGVGEGNIADVIAGGCASVADVCAATRAGTGCGSCRPEIRTILERADSMREEIHVEVLV